MNSEVKNRLDMRLANGDISQEEYIKLLGTLQSSEAPSEPLLIMRDEELTLWNDCIVYKKQRFGYDRVIGLLFSSTKDTFNFVTLVRLTSLSFNIKEGPQVYIGENAGILRGKKAPIIKQAYEIIREASCDDRRDFYLRLLLNHGAFEIDGAKLHISGAIEKNGVSIDLKEAAKEKGLYWGTVQTSGVVNGFRGQTTRHYPFDVLLKAKRPDRKILFTIPYDYDVIRDVIEMLSKPKAT